MLKKIARNFRKDMDRDPVVTLMFTTIFTIVFLCVSSLIFMAMVVSFPYGPISLVGCVFFWYYLYKKGAE